METVSSQGLQIKQSEFEEKGNFSYLQWKIIILLSLVLEPTAPVNPMETVRIDVNLTPSGSDKINISWSVSKQLSIFQCLKYLPVVTVVHKIVQSKENPGIEILVHQGRTNKGG